MTEQQIGALTRGRGKRWVARQANFRIIMREASTSDAGADGTFLGNPDLVFLPPRIRTLRLRVPHSFRRAPEPSKISVFTGDFISPDHPFPLSSGDHAHCHQFYTHNHCLQLSATGNGRSATTSHPNPGQPCHFMTVVIACFRWASKSTIRLYSRI